MRRIVCVCFFLFFFSHLHSQTTKDLSDSLLFYYQAKNFDKAIPFAEKLCVLMKEKYGTENKIYSSFLSLLGGMYFGNKQFQKAEESLLELREVNKKVFGTKSEEYSKAISMLAVLYNMKGEDDKTIPLLIESAEYYRNAFGDSSYEYASSINKLAKVYVDLGEYDQAFPLFEKATKITGLTKGVNSEEYATILNNFGILKRTTGHPELAEPMLLKAAAIRKQIAGDKDPDYANSLNNLAVLYIDLGQGIKAAEYYNKAANIFKETKGESSIEYLTALSNLGSAYDQLGEYEKAEQIYLDALSAASKKYNEDWPLYQNISKNLGQLYLAMEKYDKAEPLVLKTVASEKNKNEKSDAYGAAINDLAYLYNQIGRKQEAESLYIRSAELTKASLGGKHRNYSSTLHNLALIYVDGRQFNKAIPVMKEVTRIELDNFLNLFSILSESEKLEYIDRINFIQNSDLNILFQLSGDTTNFVSENFNTQLFIKSMLLTDSRNMLESVRNSKDSVTQRVFGAWQKDKKILSKQYALPEIDRDKDLSQLEQKVEEEEKELVSRSSGFRDLRKNLDIKFQDVQKGLKDDEAAVEFVNFRLIRNGRADSIIYAAFVIRKKDKIPQFIPLFEEQQLTAITSRFGKTSKVVVNMLYPGKKEKDYDLNSPSFQLYSLVWKPLETSLSGIKKVYYSPAGQLYNIAFHALVTDSLILLSDKYSLQQLTSIRDLALGDKIAEKQTQMNIALFGGAVFSMDSAELVNNYGQPLKSLLKTGIKKQNGAWPELAGTRDEVDAIGKLYTKNNSVAKIYMGVDASEGKLKSINNISPQTLFIATHGFFLPSPDEIKKQNVHTGNVYARADNPLLRSGLILSGGNYVWSGKKPIEGIEDGVVTAYEISQLNLSNTKLVVLSACETGLGDVKKTEGVFGLQRAFKLAGVDDLVVSLWKVPDKETSELMTTFFSYWLQGKNLTEAFNMAQADMRKKYPPYYWAAFVLVE